MRGQACGCVGEVCIGNKQIKGLLSSLNVIPDLIALLAEEDPATQVRLCDAYESTEPPEVTKRSKSLMFADIVQHASIDFAHNVSVTDNTTGRWVDGRKKHLRVHN